MSFVSFWKPGAAPTPQDKLLIAGNRSRQGRSFEESYVRCQGYVMVPKKLGLGWRDEFPRICRNGSEELYDLDA